MQPILVVAPERGGVATFLGLVRDHHQGRAVIGLSYSAYEPMAETTCLDIVAEAVARWPVRVALRHRLGNLAIGDVAVAIAVAGDHRDEACPMHRAGGAAKDDTDACSMRSTSTATDAALLSLAAGLGIPSAASALPSPRGSDRIRSDFDIPTDLAILPDSPPPRY